MKFEKGQVTIFIIIAIILVAAVAGFFIFRGGISVNNVPAFAEPVYTNFLNCLEDDALAGIDVLESQGGYIEVPAFEPGSSYMPFSNQLDFLGNPVPYWYYVSGNGIQKEQVPTKGEMEGQLEDFIEARINRCVFDSFYEEGFEIDLDSEPSAKVTIRNNEVEINLNSNLNIVKNEDSFVSTSHKAVVKSNLGSLYDSALEVYDYEQDTLFLENYGIDVLRLYAPVDGVELTCSPLTWVAEDVFDELLEAIESNTLALRTEGGNYDLKNKHSKYFVVDLNEDVRFINSQTWPNSLEVSPVEGGTLIAKPVGNQPGLGILGFCYIPYHYVYNVRYPVLVQVYEEEEIFQFPLAVVIEANNPREPVEGAVAVDAGLPEMCSKKNTLVDVNTYDTNLHIVEADISYECFGTKCDIGESVGGSLEGYFPQCVNGYILASAEGFKDAKYLYSTTSSGSVDVIMDRVYEMDVNVLMDGRSYDERVVISFISDEDSKTIVYPEQKSVELSEGQYEIQMQAFRSSSLTLQGYSNEECVEVPGSGLGGLFGFTEEKCFDLDIPDQVISEALSGGGKENYYILDSELAENNVIELSASSLPVPTTIDELQENYILFEDLGLEVYFK